MEEADGSCSTQEGVSVALSPVLEVGDLEVEEELSTMATLAWAERCLVGKMEKGGAEGLEEGDFWCLDMETCERTCRSRHVRDS